METNRTSAVNTIGSPGSFRRFAALLLCSIVLSACTSLQNRHAVAARDVDVRIPSGGEHLPGTLFVAEGRGPHPTLVWFHGFPGLSAPEPTALGILRGAGFNVLYFHYRGSWGTPGTFSVAHALEDAGAALAFVRAAQSTGGDRIDRRRIVAVGDSFGSWIALQTAAADPGVRCVAAALVLDMGRLGKDIAANDDQRAMFLQMFSQVEQAPALQFRFVAGAEGLLEEIVAGHARNSLLARAPALRDRPVLLIGAEGDALAPVAAHLEPVAAALRDSGATRIARKIFPGGHELSDTDYAGLLAQWVRGNCVQ